MEENTQLFLASSTNAKRGTTIKIENGEVNEKYSEKKLEKIFLKRTLQDASHQKLKWEQKNNTRFGKILPLNQY